MTNPTRVRPQRSKLVTMASAVCALSLAAAACGSNDDDGAVVEIGTAAADTGIEVADVANETADGAVPTTHQTASQPGELAYGDAIVDLVPALDTATGDSNTVLPGFRSVEWEDLIPPGLSGDQILERYREQLEAAEPGSPELDALYEQMNAEFDDASVNPQLDSEDIQLAGFVAPLTFDGDLITEFLLVPYFGACVHVPAPPANQTVMVSLAEGESLSIEESWGAVWVAGKMIATTTNTDLATAGYSIAAPAFGVYDIQ